MNNRLLRQKIFVADIKYNKIAAIMGITPESLRRKVNGVSEFRQSEIVSLSSILSLSFDERNDIFFGDSVYFNSTAGLPSTSPPWDDVTALVNDSQGGVATVRESTDPEITAVRMNKAKAELAKPPAWKTDYSAYQAEEQAAYDALAKDTAFHAKCQAYHPKLDIPLSLARSHEEYWSTEAAWEKKRASPSKTINWRLTYQKNIDKSPVYKETPKADYWWKPSGKPPTPPESGEGEDE